MLFRSSVSLNCVNILVYSVPKMFTQFNDTDHGPSEILQVTVECITCSFPRLQPKWSLQDPSFDDNAAVFTFKICTLSRSNTVTQEKKAGWWQEGFLFLLDGSAKLHG